MAHSGKQERTRRIVRSIAMFYMIVAFPLLFTYGILSWLTELKGKSLLYCIAPVAVVLLVVFSLYLARSIRFRSFREAERQQH